MENGPLSPDPHWAQFDFSTFPTLITPRLNLREIVPSDAADLFSFSSDPEVQKYDSDPPMRELAEAEALIKTIRPHFEAKETITWGITLKGENRLIGFVGFYFWGNATYKTDLGYTLARPYWRRGIATETVRALLQFGFDTMHLHRVNVDTRMDNIASVRLMQKLGFTQEGVRRECILNDDGTFQNWGLFGMLESEYPGASRGV
jgi:ribosomal-protein-alanine N-acetyltransferase